MVAAAGFDQLGTESFTESRSTDLKTLVFFVYFAVSNNDNCKRCLQRVQKVEDEVAVETVRKTKTATS